MLRITKRYLIFTLFVILVFRINYAFPQEVFLQPANTEVYDLLDELALNHVIVLNSVIKPYSRELIRAKLTEALKKDSLLDKRERSEIQCLLRDYTQSAVGSQQSAVSSQQSAVRSPQSAVGSRQSAVRSPQSAVGSRQSAVGSRQSAVGSHPSFNYDPLSFNIMTKSFSFSLRPFIGYEQFINENGSVYSLKAGAGGFATFWNHLGIAGGIYKTFTNQVLADPVYFTTRQGGRWNYYSNGGGDYLDWFGQVTYSWKWGIIGVFNDRMEWGNNYHGATIFTDKPPSFPFIRLKVNPAKWIEFNYYSGWLSSSVIDTSKTFSEHDGSKMYYIHKHITANLFTVTPWRYLNISFGNSIIYDGDLQFGFLIPVFFFKSLDHTFSPNIDNENSQMFLDISSRNIRHVHLYFALFVDEFKTSRIYHTDQHNFLGWKGGIHLYDLLLKNTFFTIEGTRTLPMTYQHYIPSITFENDNYNFGNYLRDNSQEIYVEAGFKPVKKLKCSASWNFAEHGDDYIYGVVPDPTRLPVLKNITWQMQTIGININYSLISNGLFFITYQYRQTTGPEAGKYTPPLFRGTTSTISFGFQLGL